MTSECGECGREFASEHAVKSHKGKMHEDSKKDVSCDNCGSELQRSPSRAEGRNFCDSDCHSEWRTGRRRSEYVEHECEFCGKVREVIPSEIKYKSPRFCSQDCYHDWVEETDNENLNKYTPSVEVECSNCLDTFSRIPSLASQNDKDFCSRECYGEWISVTRTGQGHPRWKGGYNFYDALLKQVKPRRNWKEIAEEVREEYDRCCFSCGKSEEEYQRRMDVHHVIPLLHGGTNEKWNLIPLCGSCHKLSDAYIAGLQEVPCLIDAMG